MVSNNLECLYDPYSQARRSSFPMQGIGFGGSFNSILDRYPTGSSSYLDTLDPLSRFRMSGRDSSNPFDPLAYTHPLSLGLPGLRNDAHLSDNSVGLRSFNRLGPLGSQYLPQYYSGTGLGLAPDFSSTGPLEGFTFPDALGRWRYLGLGNNVYRPFQAFPEHFPGTFRGLRPLTSSNLASSAPRHSYCFPGPASGSVEGMSQNCDRDADCSCNFDCDSVCDFKNTSCALARSSFVSSTRHRHENDVPWFPQRLRLASALARESHMPYEHCRMLLEHELTSVKAGLGRSDKTKDTRMYKISLLWNHQSWTVQIPLYGGRDDVEGFALGDDKPASPLKTERKLADMRKLEKELVKYGGGKRNDRIDWIADYEEWCD